MQSSVLFTVAVKYAPLLMVTSANTPPPKLLGPVRSLCPLVESVLRFNADSNLNLNRETVSGT